MHHLSESYGVGNTTICDIRRQCAKLLKLYPESESNRALLMVNQCKKLDQVTLIGMFTSSFYKVTMKVYLFLGHFCERSEESKGESDCLFVQMQLTLL